MKALRYWVLGLALVAGSGWGQSVLDKSKPLKIIVPSGTASTGDVMARAYARAITEVSGLTVIVENRPGAEGVIGVQAVKTAPPDGYTIMMTSNSTQVLNLHMLPSVPYDPVADFIPLAGAGSAPLVMYVGANSPFKSAREFIAAARQNPGKYSFGSNVTLARLGAEMLESLAGIKLMSVPFKSLTDVMTSVSTGEVDVTFATLSSGGAFAKSGRMRMLAVTGSVRMKALPDVPTLQEEGVARYDLVSWLATYAPARTPPAVVSNLRDIMSKAGKTSYVTDVHKMFALEPLNLAGEELTALQRNESANWGKLMPASSPRAQ